MNIVEPILFQALYQPEAPALCAQGVDVLSYARLVAQMNAVARRALASGLKRGDVVALSTDMPLLHAAVILGLTQAGMIPVSVGTHKPPAGLKVDAVLRSTNYPFAPQARHLPLDYGWLAGTGAPVEVSPSGKEAIDAVCRIVLTSGMTGDPKAVALTHGLLAARNARREYTLGNRYPNASRIFIDMGLAAAAAYKVLAHSLSRGGTVFFHGQSVENTLRGFEIFRIEAMVATPASLANLLAACDRHPGIEVHVDTIASTGSLMPPPLVERVRPRLCRHLITGYGSTETAYNATAPAHRIAHIPGAVGYVTPGSRIEIVDEADRPLPRGTEGIVRIASEFAVDRYIDDPVESAKVFRNGWFYPGDLGALTADNLLIIAGRQNDVLNAGGGKLAAEKVEAMLLAFPSVSEAAVFMATSPIGAEEAWAAVVCREELDIEKLRAFCRPRLPAEFMPAHFRVLDALPVNTTGKVDRPRLKEMLTGSTRAAP